MGRSADDRWVEVSPSQFPHEVDGLALVKAVLPEQPPFRAWSNFEFRDNRGRWHEVDLLVLGRSGLHLIELKWYSGVLRGDDHTWRRDGHRAEESPLKLARRKAQYFSSLLKDELDVWKRETRATGVPAPNQVVPWVQEAVFLHHDRFTSELSPRSAINLYGLDGAGTRTHLPGISELLLQPARPDRTIYERILVELMKRVGLVQRREREAGSWVIQDQPVAEGDGWQEWDAHHRISQTRRGRIRISVATPGASQEELRRLRALAEHEYGVLRRLRHEAVVPPEDLVDSELGVGLVYPYEEGWQRLDLWVADQTAGVPLETALAITRQVGEALQYAHGNKVVHRGLTPQAVWVRLRRDGGVHVQVRDWRAAGLVPGDSTQSASQAGVTALFGARSSDTDAGDGWVDAFAAPEGAMSAGVDRVRVDVYGLGSLAFYLVAGQPGARSVGALRTRLREQSGLDLAAELTQVSSPLRSAVLGATRPAVSERTADVATFLAHLSEEERDADHDTGLDPLDAPPGAVLDGRFRLVRRLGSGSTAAGLLVDDLGRTGEPEAVLKVALDAIAGPRLDDEAEVLGALRSPRIVALLEPALTVGGRRALLLENAGPDTLATHLRPGRRLSLDLLERWGTDLLEALVALDRAGVDHRDVKPANLGVSSRRNQAQHLVLFDFSLSRAAASAVRAGTPPYLDPFLGLPGRDRYDSAAERYAAAVVLFEMATGGTPTFGDGQTDPATIADEARVVAELFDPTLGPALVVFFATALAREVEARYDTVADLLTAWRLVFSQTDTGVPDDAPGRQQAAALETELTQSGLSARALSALDPLGVRTVADLVAVDAARFNRISGTATKGEIKQAAQQWRGRFGRGRRAATPGSGLPDPDEAVEVLLAVARTGRGSTRTEVLGRVLGVTGDVDGFATQSQIGAGLPEPVGGARVGQVLDELQSLWGGDAASRDLLDRLGALVAERLIELGKVATAHELAAHVLAAMDPEARSDSSQARYATGLVRLALERQRALLRGGADATDYAVRRRRGRPALVAARPELLDLADALGSVADALVRHDVDPVVPPERAAEALLAVVEAFKLASGPAEPERLEVVSGLAEPERLVRLAATVSEQAAASGRGELHPRDLAPAVALAMALEGVSSGQPLSAPEVRERVRVRFPALVVLPDQPDLEPLVRAAGLPLTWDPRRKVFRAADAAEATTGLETRAPTALAPGTAPVAVRGVVGQRLTDSIARRSFLALGATSLELARLQSVLVADYRAQPLDLTTALLTALRAESDAAGMAWSVVLAADAQPRDSRAGRGLGLLVGRAIETVLEQVDSELDDPGAGGGAGPLLLLGAAPLARYQAVGRLSRWTDLARGRARAVWLLLPQLWANRGALLDGIPIPLASPSQFVPVDPEWVSARLLDLGSDSAPSSSSRNGDSPVLSGPVPVPPTGRPA